MQYRDRIERIKDGVEQAYVRGYEQAIKDCSADEYKCVRETGAKMGISEIRMNELEIIAIFGEDSVCEE